MLADGLRLIELDVVSSTNDVIREAIERGEPEGLVVTARRQDGGQGRRGSSWASPEGGLYLSMLLDPGMPVEAVPTLGMVAAASACRALSSFLPDDSDASFGIKWPNDVILRGASGPRFRKASGISTDLVKGKVCLGIGINVMRPEEEGPCSRSSEGADPEESVEALRRGKNVPAYLSDHVPQEAMPSVAIVRDAFMDAFASGYAEWRRSPRRYVREEVGPLSALDGIVVDIEARHASRAAGIEGERPSGHGADDAGHAAPVARVLEGHGDAHGPMRLHALVDGIADDGSLIVHAVGDGLTGRGPMDGEGPMRVYEGSVCIPDDGASCDTHSPDGGRMGYDRGSHPMGGTT